MTSTQEVYSELNGLDLEGHIQNNCQVETIMVGQVYQTKLSLLEKSFLLYKK